MDIRVQFIAGLYFDLFQAVVLQQRMELADDQFNALSPGGCFTIFGPVAVREFQIIQDGQESFQDITFEAVLSNDRNLKLLKEQKNKDNSYVVIMF